MNKRWIRYAVAGGIALCVILPVAVLRGAFSSREGKVTAMALCDGCFAAAVAIGGIGLLCRIADGGSLDLIGFTAGRLRASIRRERYMSYYEYREQKRAKRTGGYGFLLVIGGICLALSLLMLAIWAAV